MQRLRSIIWPAMAALVLIGMVNMMPLAVGQDDKGPADPKAVDKKDAAKADVKKDEGKTDADSKKDDESTVLAMVRKSGPSGLAFFIVLGLFSLFALTVAIERLVNLTRGNIVPVSFAVELRKILDSGDAKLADLSRVAKKYDVPVSKALRSGIFRGRRPTKEVEKAMEDTVLSEVSVLRGRIRPLSVTATVAPLVGLLGTVVGMIMAFYNTSQAGRGGNIGGKAEMLAEGIYLALLTTAAGLTIAIPCYILAAFFNSRVDKFAREMGDTLSETLPLFDRLENTESEEGYQTVLPAPVKQPEPAEKSTELVGADH